MMCGEWAIVALFVFLVLVNLFMLIDSNFFDFFERQ